MGAPCKQASTHIRTDGEAGSCQLCFPSLPSLTSSFHCLVCFAALVGHTTSQPIAEEALERSSIELRSKHQEETKELAEDHRNEVVPVLDVHSLVSCSLGFSLPVFWVGQSSKPEGPPV